MSNHTTGGFEPKKDYLTRNQVIEALRTTTGMKPHARLVLLGYLEHLQYRSDGSKHIEQQYVCFPSQETVAQFAGVNKSTVSTYTKFLTEANWLIEHDTRDVPVYDSSGRQIGQRTITLRAFGRGTVSDDLMVKARGRVANLRHQTPSDGDTVTPPPTVVGTPSNGGRDTPRRQLEDPPTVVGTPPDGGTVTNNHSNYHSDNHSKYHSNYHLVDSAGAPSTVSDSNQDKGSDPTSLISEGKEVAGEARKETEPTLITENSGASALSSLPETTPSNGDTVEGVNSKDSQPENTDEDRNSAHKDKSVRSYDEAAKVAREEGCGWHFRNIYSESNETRTDWLLMLDEARERQMEDSDDEWI